MYLVKAGWDVHTLILLIRFQNCDSLQADVIVCIHMHVHVYMYTCYICELMKLGRDVDTIVLVT